MYFYVPAVDVLLGFKNLFCHEDYKDDVNNNIDGKDKKYGWYKEMCWNGANHAKIPAWKLFEQLGEAVPQGPNSIEKCLLEFWLEKQLEIPHLIMIHDLTTNF